MHRYPNPFSNEIHLRVYTKDITTPIVVKVFDASGTEVEVRNHIMFDSDDILIGNGLPAGVYVIQVIQGTNIQVQRIVKVK